MAHVPPRCAEHRPDLAATHRVNNWGRPKRPFFFGAARRSIHQAGEKGMPGALRNFEEKHEKAYRDRGGIIMKNTLSFLLVLLWLALISAGCSGGGGTAPAVTQSVQSTQSAESGEMEYFLPADAGSVAADPDEKFLFVADELYVELQAEQPPSLANQMAALIGGSVTGSIPDEDLFQITFTRNFTYDELIAKADLLENTYPGIEALVDYYFDTEDYTDYEGEGADFTAEGNHWGQDAIKLPEAWNYATENFTLKKVSLGVVDCGFDVYHEDLSANIVYYSPSNNIAGKSADHGTHVCGIIGAVDNYGAGTTGKGLRGACLTPQFYLYRSTRVNDPEIEGTVEQSAANIATALHAAISAGVRVVNVSMGKTWYRGGEWLTHDGEPPSLSNRKQKRMIEDANEWYEMAVKLASKKNCLIVKSAGNSRGIDSYWSGMTALVTTYPNNLIVVANAYDETGELSSTSNDNVDNTYISVCAPGTEIWSSIPDDRYTWKSGTSMAAPFVTGVAGLVLSVKSDLSAGDLKKILVETASPGADDIPLINAHEAVKRAGKS